MLWYKAWRESRGRFFLSVTAVAILCAAAVVFRDDARTAYEQPLSYAAYIWRSVYKGFVRDLFVLLAVVLALGGLLRERARGTASFTLALPVGRKRLVAARAAVGALEVAALSLVPAVVLPALSPWIHESYPVGQALEFGVLWSVGGALFFAVGFLASTLFGGEYTAGVGAFLALVAYSVIVELPGVEAHVADVHDLMSGAGMPWLDRATSTLAGPLPWLSLGATVLIAVALVAVAAWATRRQDF